MINLINFIFLYCSQNVVQIMKSDYSKNILVYTFLLAGRSGRIWDGWKGTNGEQCSDTQACDTTTI